MPFPPIWSLLAVPLLIAVNAFFVCAEYALVAIRNTQLEDIRKRGWQRTASAMQAMKNHMAESIGAVQICITGTNLALGAIGEPAMTALLQWAFDFALPEAIRRPLGATVGFLIVTLATVVLSELLPKAMTLQHTMLIARLTAWPMRIITMLILPLVWVMSFSAQLSARVLGLGPIRIEDAVPTAEEIRSIASEAADAGSLTTRERSLILNSLALGRKTAEQIMVPRVQVSYLDLQKTMAENRATIGDYLYSRLPLCDGGMDRVVGVIYTKEFLTAAQEAGEDSGILALIARPATFAPVSVRLDGLIQVFNEQGSHLVFLVDEYGGVEGIVTLTDVVDELLGELREGTASDEASLEENVLYEMHAADGTHAWQVRGSMPVHDLAELIGEEVEWAREDYATTIGGLIVAKLGGRFADAGDEVTIGPVTLRVIESDRRRVHRVRVVLNRG